MSAGGQIPHESKPLSVACPWCFASAGQACLPPTEGNVFHQKRIKKAAASGGSQEPAPAEPPLTCAARNAVGVARRTQREMDAGDMPDLAPLFAAIEIVAGLLSSGDGTEER